MIDFHSHVLPCIDDGPKNAETSVSMLESSYNQGVRHIVATPHFYANRDLPENFFEKRRNSVEMLASAYGSKALPQLYLGAEVAFFNGISNSGIIADMCIEGTKYILIEMPEYRWSESETEELIKIRKRGCIPIVAHIERCMFSQNKGVDSYLAENGILFQANCSFFYGFSTRRKAVKMLENDRVHLIGTDMHNTEDRIPDMEQAYAYIKSKCDMFEVKRIESISRIILESATAVLGAGVTEKKP